MEGAQGTKIQGGIVAWIARSDPRLLAAAIASVAVAARLAYLVMGGVRVGADTTTYMATCDQLASGSVAAFEGLVGLEYLGFVGPMCLVVKATGGSLGSWIGIQILLGVVASVLVFDTGRRLFDPIAGVAAGLALALLWETFQWDIYVLSDTTFVFVLCLLVWSLVRLDEAPRDTSRKILAWGVLGYLLISRPMGGPIVAALLALDLLPQDNRWRLGLSSSRLPAVGLLVLMAVAILGFTSRVGWVESNLYEVWSQGVLVHDDPTFSYPYTPAPADGMMVFALLNVPHLVVMAVAKFGLFFLPVVDRFSIIHNIVNLVILLPVMAGAVVGTAGLLKEREPRIRFVLVPLAVILLVATVTFIDYDWRYRAPAGPLFALLFGFAVDRALDRWTSQGWDDRL